jgi:hypothetical protein
MCSIYLVCWFLDSLNVFNSLVVKRTFNKYTYLVTTLYVCKYCDTAVGTDV